MSSLFPVDGDCPSGTVGVADYDFGTGGQQNAVTLKGGKTASGRLPVTATAAGFYTTNRRSPARCVATVSAAGPGGDTDASNNTTKLVIDVYDKNDFWGDSSEPICTHRTHSAKAWSGNSTPRSSFRLSALLSDYCCKTAVASRNLILCGCPAPS